MASKRQTRHRRLNRNKAPWDTLPVITVTGDRWTPDAERTITVIRGTFDTSELTSHDLRYVSDEGEYVVFTNRLGHHRLQLVGALVAAELDWNRLELISTPPFPGDDDTIADLAQRVRDEAANVRAKAEAQAQALEARAQQFDDMAGDGWEIAYHPEGHYPMLLDTLDDGRPDLRPSQFG